MTGRHLKIEYMMQVPGHARCLVDSGFACIKKLYRRTDCDSKDQLEGVVNKSSTTNVAVRYPAWQWLDWKSFLEPIIKPLTGIRYVYYARYFTLSAMVLLRTYPARVPTLLATVGGGHRLSVQIHGLHGLYKCLTKSYTILGIKIIRL